MRAQRRVREMILEVFPELEADIKTAVASEPGVDLHLSARARELFPFAVECRNRERLNLWTALRDAERHAATTGLTPLAIVSRNRLPEPYACLPFSALLRLLALIARRERQPPSP